MITSIRQRKDGFTILELLIVAIIIGVLLALVFTTYAGIREKERNTQRQNDITTLQSKLELYYAENSKYPTFAEMTSPTWLADNQKIIAVTLLQDPSSSSALLVSSPKPHAYAYIVTASDGSSCDNVSKVCAEYTLTATLEGGGTYTKSSLN
jgi:prepilin-type N-terminal cleavage/methylation domain-containing protein